jgi:hypothetical protein
MGLRNKSCHQQGQSGDCRLGAQPLPSLLYARLPVFLPPTLRCALTGRSFAVSLRFQRSVTYLKGLRLFSLRSPRLATAAALVDTGRVILDFALLHRSLANARDSK